MKKYIILLLLLFPITLMGIEKSTNAYLEELKIRGYEIDFQKEISEYNITILDSENRLSIKAVTDDLRSTYEIIGSEDLRANGNTVLINVTSESGNTFTYKINVSYESETIIENKFNIKDFYLQNKKFILLISSIIGVVVLVMLILLINGIIKDKKLDKMFDKF